MAARRNDFNNQPYYDQTQERRQQAGDIAGNIHYAQPFPSTSINHRFGMQQQIVSNELRTRLPFSNMGSVSGATQQFGHAESFPSPFTVPLMEINCNASAFSGANQQTYRKEKKATVDTRGAATSPHNRCRSASTSSIASDASTPGSQQPEHRASISGEKMKQKASKKFRKKNKETKDGRAAGKSAATSNCTVSSVSSSSSDSQAMSSSSSCSTVTNNTSIQPKNTNKKRNRRSSSQSSNSESSKCGSDLANKDKSQVSSSRNNESKTSEVEIVFNRITEPAIVECYLEDILSGESFNFRMETAQCAALCTKYMVKFSSLKQAKKAVRILHKLNKGEGSEATDMAFRLIRKKETAESEMIVKCAREIKQKATDLMTAHEKKIKEIEKKLQNLPTSKKGKGMSLDLFWDVKPKKEALNSKMLELERQKKEFEMFLNSFQNKIEALKEDPGSEFTESLKQLRTGFGREKQRFEMALPIYARKSEIIQAVRDTQVCVILAETGSGKSTQITQYLYEEGYAEKGIIVCTQPRKVAATSLSNYVASQMGSRPGQLVSSIVGARGKTTAKTAILYMTDHALLNECLRDPDLTKYSCVIVDEAHERSIFTDLLLGMIKKALSKRADLRVIITSATIDPGLFLRYFSGCQKLEVSGRMFPVEMIWKETKSGEGNYVVDAVEQACKVHETEESGDVLVFLTSPAEIQKACEMMSKLKAAEIECLPLHGKLNPDDQQKVFQQTPGKRKIIFATNCAETSVTIPGIKFVIDSGMVKEMQYDAKRNMNSLNVRSINKSSAEQRKGRAGRLEAGKCFRLYSEEDYCKMDDRSTPEILRVHLGQAILKLMELGIDPTVFDFVESPPTESLISACQSLMSLGAVLDGCLTDLGKKMARLPMEPRLAKLLIVGIEEGVGKDAMILASVATVNGSIFFRMGTEEEKRQHDMKKIRFCHSGGDLLTLLNVYQEWQQLPARDKRARNKWCCDNSLNAKAMRMADETIKDLTTILRQELAINNLQRVSNVTEQAPENETESTDENNTKLRKIVMSCYALNLCMYTGNERAGYRITSSNDCVQLHPSSSLKYLDHPPQFVVYEQLMKTTKDYILNITPVEGEWVEEYALRGMLPNLTFEELEKLKSEVLVPNSLTCSKVLMQCAVGLGFKGKSMRAELEEQVSRSCDGALNVIEANPDKGNVKIYVAQQHKRNSLEVVEERLETHRKRFRNGTVEKPLKEDSNDVRVVIGRGGVVQHVLMPNMYRSVRVSNILEDQSLENVLNFLGTDEEILEHEVWYKKEMMNVSVLFRDPDKAMQVVQLASEPDCGFMARPSASIKRSLHPTKFKVKVAWTRRQSKGMASFTLKNSEDFVTASCKLVGKFVVKHSLASFSIDKNRPESIFVKGLGADIFEADLIAFVEEHLNKTQPLFVQPYPKFSEDDCDDEEDESDGQEDESDDQEDEKFDKDCDDSLSRQKIEVESLFIIREKSYESSEQECENMKVQLKSAVEKIAPNARFEIKLIKPKAIHLQWIAYLEFDDANEGYTVVRELDGRPLGEYSFRGKYRVTPELHCTLTCFKNTYQVTEKILHKLQRSIADECSRKCARSVQFEPKEKGKIVQLELKAECVQHYVHLRNALSDVLSGDKLDCKASKDLEVLLTKQGNDFLSKVEKDTHAVIQRDWRTCCLFIYGSDAVKTKAKTAINDFLNDIVTNRSDLWEVNLRADNKPRGLIKAIIKRFGASLERLQAVDGVTKVSLNLRNHVLSIQSTPEAKAVIEEQIGACIAALPTPPKSEPHFPKEECPVCLSEPEDKSYRLVCCGHVYCKDCITSQLQALELPLKCAVENCQEEFVWKDLELLLNQKEMGRLVKEAIKKYVASHQEQVKYCPTPNCYMVYRVTQDGQRFSCSACGTATCTSCHIEYHVGLTCSMYQSEKRDGGLENLKNWMGEDKKNRKRCPKCNAFIEKNGGCNHMTCDSCREHFCWLCLARCGSENGFYMHQRNCPRKQKV